MARRGKKWKTLEISRMISRLFSRFWCRAITRDRGARSVSLSPREVSLRIIAPEAEVVLVTVYLFLFTSNSHVVLSHVPTHVLDATNNLKSKHLSNTK